MSPQPTVRDETFAVMRRLGMTRVFGNPGSTEIPFLTDFPDDLEFVLGLHEGAVVGMASGYALGTGRPGLRQPAHGARPRQRRQRDRLRTRQPDPARDRRRPAGPAPARARPVPHRPQPRPSRGRLPGLDDAAGAPAAKSPARSRAPDHEAVVRRGPALVVVPMGDWDEPLGDGWAGPAAPAPPAARQPPSTRASSTSSPSSSQAASSPALVVGAGLDTPEGWAAVVGARGAARLPGLAGHVLEPHGLPAGSSDSSPATCPGSAASCARPSRATTSCSPSARRRFGSTCTTPGRSSSRAHAWPSSATIPTTCSAARATWRCSLAPASRLRRAGRAHAAAERPPSRRCSAPRPAPPAPGEALRAAHVVAALAQRLPRRTRSSSRRRRRPGPRCSRASRPGRRSASSPSPTARSASGSRARSGFGWRCPSARFSRCSATARRCTRSRRSGRAASYGVGVVFVVMGERTLRRDGRARPAPRRARARGPRSTRSSSPRSPRAWAAPHGASRRTTSWWRRSTR